MSSATSRPRDGERAARRQPGLPLSDGWVVVGRIVGAHGVRGEVKIAPETDFPERLAELAEVTLLMPDGQRATVGVSGGRLHVGKGTVLLALAGYSTRTAAQTLRGALVLVRTADSPSLPNGQYYEWQIVGLRAVTTEGRDLGVVREVIHTGANDVYATEVCLLPAISEVIRDVDLARGRLVVEPLPGLLD